MHVVDGKPVFVEVHPGHVVDQPAPEPVLDGLGGAGLHADGGGLRALAVVAELERADDHPQGGRGHAAVPAGRFQRDGTRLNHW